jgi:aldehyde dehydrogenase (NAD+)
MDRARIFLDGEWVDSTDSAKFAVVCPSTEEILDHAIESTTDDVDRAVAAARRQFDEGKWPGTPAAERAAVIRRAAASVSGQAEEIGRLVTSEMGQPISTSTGMISRVDGIMDFLAGLAERTPVAELRLDGGPSAVVKEPVGVVAGIAPWNAPLNSAVTKIVPALLAGCCVVFKPAPETPFDAGYLADALTAAGLPPGALNIITGGAKPGEFLVGHPGIDKVAFTGSSAVGRRIGSIAGGQLKRLQLELGGKSAAIILDDAEMQAVTSGLSAGCFFNSGQVCSALTRVLAPRGMVGEVVEALRTAASQWVPGDPFDPATTLGPLAGERHRARVESYIRAAVAEGAKVAFGGGRPASLPKGWYIEPTVLTGVTNSMKVAREEIFGPVIVVIPHDGEQDAIRLANDSPYGLHGAVFTRDTERALAVARRIRTGTFSVNNFVYNNRAPFGGVKGSGVGRDTGQEGLESNFELKTINLAPGMERLIAPGKE